MGLAALESIQGIKVCILVNPLVLLQLITITSLDIERVESWQAVVPPTVQTSDSFQMMGAVLYGAAFLNWMTLERYIGFQQAASDPNEVPEAEQAILRLVGMGAIAYGINSASRSYYKKGNRRMAWFLRLGTSTAMTLLAVQNYKRGNRLRMEFKMTL